MAIIAETILKGIAAFEIRNPIPVDPVREEGELRPLRGDIFACGGEPCVHEIEMRPWIFSHGIATDGTGETSVVSRTVRAET